MENRWAQGNPESEWLTQLTGLVVCLLAAPHTDPIQLSSITDNEWRSQYSLRCQRSSRQSNSPAAISQIVMHNVVTGHVISVRSQSE